MAKLDMKMCVEILSPHPMSSRDDGERVLDIWEKYLQGCLPDKVGNWEPIDNVFALDRKDAILDLWNWPFFAAKKNPKMYADFFMRKGKMLQHASWGLNFNYKEVDNDKVAVFLREATRLLEADFVCLTLLTDSEIENGRRNGTVSSLDKKRTRFSFQISSHRIQKCLPDVYWMTIFGAPYVQMFGKELLLSAPAYKVEAISDGFIAIQLTPSLEDMQSDPSGFAATRAKLKAFLGETAFFDSERTTDCIRPEFMWR